MRDVDDEVAREEPFEIRLRHGPLSRQKETSLGITMRTPGDDAELAVGLLYNEGILERRSDLVHLTECRADGETDFGNALLAELDPSRAYRPPPGARDYVRSSACGICGAASIEVLRKRELAPLPAGSPRVKASVLRLLPSRLQSAQRVFGRTGGLHAAGLFDADGKLLLIREDVGRHNAVDKVVGRLFLDGALPSSASVLVASGRAGFEIVAKARTAGIPVVAAIGAPSSLAVELAVDSGMTLVGFLGSRGFNVYSGSDRLAGATARPKSVRPRRRPS